MSFNHKVAIVTGASSGIGAATAVKLTREGASVAIVARNRIKLDAVASQCAQYGKMPLIIIADLTISDHVATVISNTIKQFGQIDILINNAGFGTKIAFENENSMVDFDSVLNLNLRAAVHLTHLAVPYLTETRGNVVNISSVSSLTTMPEFWAYCTAKAGLDHFSRCIAVELAPKGIRVNVINPGPVKTDFIENMGYKEYEAMIMDKFTERTALKRVSEPHEIADIILFLASEKAKGVTGANWVADNGYLLL